MVPLILAPPPPLVFHQPASLLSPPLSRSLQAARDNQHTQQETSSTPLPQTPFPNSASALEDLFSARLVEYRAGWRPPPSPPASPIQQAMLQTLAFSLSHTPPADLHGLLRLLSMSPSLTPQVLFLKPAAAQTKQHTQQETSFTPLPQTPFPNSASALEDLFSARLVEYRAGWRPQPSPLSPEH